MSTSSFAPPKLEMIGQPLLEPQKVPLPLYASTIQAGFPSPADDYVEQTLDLNEYCISNPSATYLLRVHPDGDSMIDAGIYPHDIVVVDRSLQPQAGDIVVAAVDQEFTLKELNFCGQKPVLKPHNTQYPTISIVEGQDFEVFGVVVSVIRKLKRRGTRSVRPY